MKKVILAADSSMDMPKEIIEKYDIRVIPFYVTFGDETYKDGEDMDITSLYKKVEETGTLPKTAANAPDAFITFFTALKKEAEKVVFFSLGAELSSSYGNAVLAAEEVGNVFVLDTGTLSSAEGLIILHGADMVAAGADAEEIFADCTAYAKKCDTSFVLDQLDYMHKGGRCSGIAALGANVLGIKPCLAMEDGRLGVQKKYRGKLAPVLRKYVEERLADAEVDDTRVFLTDSVIGSAEHEAALTALRESGRFKEIILAKAGCVIASHCGPGTLGILFARK